MRVLEVRFRPQPYEPWWIVGHLIWFGRLDREPALTRQSPTMEGITTSEDLITKLEYLLSATAPDPFARLQQMRSPFWSFVEVAASALQGPSLGDATALAKSWLRAR